SDGRRSQEARGIPARQAAANEADLSGRAEDPRQGRDDRSGTEGSDRRPRRLFRSSPVQRAAERARAAEGRLMSASSTEPPDKNPFPGLRPFTENEEHLFFGRENQVDAMVDKLAATHFLAVVGTSGSGKSSLVNCGLRPSLSRGLMARAGTSWRI